MNDTGCEFCTPDSDARRDIAHTPRATLKLVDYDGSWHLLSLAKFGGIVDIPIDVCLMCGRKL